MVRQPGGRPKERTYVCSSIVVVVVLVVVVVVVVLVRLVVRLVLVLLPLRSSGRLRRALLQSLGLASAGKAS